MDRLKELLQEVADEANREVNSIEKLEKIVRDLLDELSEMTYLLKPSKWDYSYIGITESDVLDTKKKLRKI